jgi:hypothetical protein
VIL